MAVLKRLSYYAALDRHSIFYINYLSLLHHVDWHQSHQEHSFMTSKDEALDFRYFNRSVACPWSKTSGKAARQL
jgi:hypothetical protein